MNHQRRGTQYYKYPDSPSTSYCTSDTSSSMASTVVTTNTLSSSLVIYDDEDISYCTIIPAAPLNLRMFIVHINEHYGDIWDFPYTIEEFIYGYLKCASLTDFNEVMLPADEEYYSNRYGEQFHEYLDAVIELQVIHGFTVYMAIESQWDQNAEFTYEDFLVFRGENKPIITSMCQLPEIFDWTSVIPSIVCHSEPLVQQHQVDNCSMSQMDSQCTNKRIAYIPVKVHKCSVKRNL